MYPKTPSFPPDGHCPSSSPHPLSDSPLAFLPPAGHAHAPTAGEAGTLPKAYQCFINVITVLNWPPHPFTGLSSSPLCLLIYSSTPHVMFPFFEPEQPCWFRISLFFFKLIQGRFAESACSFSSPCCLSVIQLHMLKLEGSLLHSSSKAVWGSFVLFKGRENSVYSPSLHRYPQLLCRLQVCFSNKVLHQKSSSFLLLVQS